MYILNCRVSAIFLCMFQQEDKFYLSTSNWNRYQRFNYENNTKDKRQDIDNLLPNKSKFPCNFKIFNTLKASSGSTQKSDSKKSNSTYSLNSVKKRLPNEAGGYTGIDILKLKQKMANTLSVMTNVLRNVVSKQRIRYKEKGFNLDLAYICDNIIAMGYPADNYESMYRNPLGDVYKFLEDNHHDHYKIYNLCLERSYDIAKFHGRVSVYPFEDHNPPTIELILRFCEDVDNWLKANSQNVAAVHCKAGKGRTGTMICCYMLYCGQHTEAEDALACYDEKRTKDRKGVTIPSQRRYVHYFAKLIQLRLPYQRRTLQFCEIRFSKANTLHNQGTVHCSISVLQDKVQHLKSFPIDFRKNNVLDMKNPSLPVSGDIKVELIKNNKKIFHFWFNTFFVTDSSVIEGEGNDVKFVYTLQKREIDDVHKDKCYPDDFKIDLVFYVDDNNIDCAHMRVSADNRVTSNSTTLQNNETIQMPSQQQSQVASSGSEINFMCDQKSSSSTSVCSSLGVTGSDVSNGCERNKSTTDSRYYMASKCASNGGQFPAALLVKHITQLPRYSDKDQHQQQQYKMTTPLHKEKQNHQGNKLTSNQLYFQESVSYRGDIVSDSREVHAYYSKNLDATCPPSSNSNSNSPNIVTRSSNINADIINNRYNGKHSSSSKKNVSISSQTFLSANGDIEEDWESGESHAKQLENITILVSTSSLTKSHKKISPLFETSSPPFFPETPASPNTTLINFPPSLKYYKTCSSDCFKTSTTLKLSSYFTSYNLSIHPKNKNKTNSSTCINRIVSDVKNIKCKKMVPSVSYAKDTNVKSVEFNKKDNNISSSSGFEADQESLVLAASCRPKLSRLLMIPKNLQKQNKLSYKRIFIRKSANNKLLRSLNCNTSNCATTIGCLDNSLDPSAPLAISTGGGVATTSKLMLKLKLKKKKLKLLQKFQSFQSYFRNDPVYFCKNFVQHTTDMRHNSMCSMSSRTNMNTTLLLVTPPLPIVEVNSSFEQLKRHTYVYSASTSNTSIATGDLCDGYYSSLCDNQLSFTNSPCKSPHLMADITCGISGSCGVFSIDHNNLNMNFTKSSGRSNFYLRERKDTFHVFSSYADCRQNNGNVVIIAAKPLAVGFNVNATNSATQDSFETNEKDEDVEGSPLSIYYTPPRVSISSADTNKYANSAFIFTQVPDTIGITSDNVERSNTNISLELTTTPTSKPISPLSLNLVIVKEYPKLSVTNKAKKFSIP